MTLVQGRGYPCWECFFVASFVAPFVTPPDFSLPSESESSKQLNGPLRPKSSATATSVSKYSKDDLQQIFKAVLKA